ncbi:MAG: hypothetical protein RL442_1984 [Pseudomonadota bacterium]|jgi:hypothetical protein
MPPPDLWNELASAGLPALLMAMAVWWLQKSNRELLTELNRERTDRLDLMQEQIAKCEDDRAKLWQALMRHIGDANLNP